jgi:hypothetical protein
MMDWFGHQLKDCINKKQVSGTGISTRCLLLAGCILVVFSGCASFGPQSMDRDRFDYINAIASSWKQQTLLNIVKMRYADTPIFLEVGQIISGYQLEGTIAMGGSLSASSAYGDIFSLGTTGRYTDRPTITYTPMTGSHFMHVLLTPIPPPALFMVIEQGWPVDLLFQIGVQKINGVSNGMGGLRGYPPDPNFVRLLEALQRLQASRVIGLRVEMSQESKQIGTIMTISKKNLPLEIQADRELVRKLLGLRPDQQEFKIIYGGISDKDDVIAVQTRSGLQILKELGADVQVPSTHIAERRTYPPVSESSGIGSSLQPLLRIHADKSRPIDVFAAVKYNDYWYWIDNRDFKSKGVFTFLMIIMTLAEKEEKIQPPIVTIQGN